MGDDPEWKRTTATSFGTRADGYRTSSTHSQGADLDLIAEWCADATTALDIATGAGHTAGALHHAGVPVAIASDAALPMVTTSTDSFPGIGGLVGDAERLPFTDGAFDAVTCRIAAHHFPDPEAFVTETARVLQPDGRFAFEDNVAPENDTLAAFLNRLESLRDPTHVESYQASTWHDWLTGAGFTIEDTIPFTTRIDVPEWIDRITALTPADKARIVDHLTTAPESAREYFDIQSTDGVPESFTNHKVIILATHPHTDT